VLREGVERFPAAFLDQDAAEIRLLCDHRDSFVKERTRLINRLRINLVILDPELEVKVPSRKLDYPGQLQRITRRLPAMPQTARVRIAREQVKRIDALTREAEALKRELRDLVRSYRPELLAETGCGPLCAAILVGQTTGAERFASDAHFARAAGVAPIPVSSGRHDRHRLDRGGNRQLNRALHVIAITRGRIDPETRDYLARKEAEGKIKSIIETTGVKIDVLEDGTVHIFSTSGAGGDAALQMVRDITASAEIGKTYLGKVVRLAEFGAFVELFPGTDGLLHISEISEHRIRDVRDELKLGDQVLVKVLSIEGNKVRLSRKALIKEAREKQQKAAGAGATTTTTSTTEDTSTEADANISE